MEKSNLSLLRILRGCRAESCAKHCSVVTPRKIVSSSMRVTTNETVALTLRIVNLLTDRQLRLYRHPSTDRTGVAPVTPPSRVNSRLDTSHPPSSGTDRRCHCASSSSLYLSLTSFATHSPECLVHGRHCYDCEWSASCNGTLQIAGAAIHFGDTSRRPSPVPSASEHERRRRRIKQTSSTMSPWLITFVAFVPVLLVALAFLRSTVLSKYLDDRYEKRHSR